MSQNNNDYEMTEYDIFLEVLEDRKRAKSDDPKDPIELMLHNSRKYHELKDRQKAEKEARLKKEEERRKRE